MDGACCVCQLGVGSYGVVGGVWYERPRIFAQCVGWTNFRGIEWPEWLIRVVLYQLCKALFFGGVVEQLGQEVALCVESGPNGDTVQLVYNYVIEDIVNSLFIIHYI